VGDNVQFDSGPADIVESTDRQGDEQMKLTIKDYTRYAPERSRTGGDYGYEETATVENYQIVAGSYRTTSEFDYCSSCGRFERRMGEHIERQHDGNGEDYQPSPEMLYAVLLLDERVPARTTELFDEWSNRMTLVIEGEGQCQQ
jgi:hypothetical protein